MPSEYSPVWRWAKMSRSQIIKMQKQQEMARKLAEEKLAQAKKSDEWKQEENILKKIEHTLEDENFTTPIHIDTLPEKKLSLWQRIILFFKSIFH